MELTNDIWNKLSALEAAGRSVNIRAMELAEALEELERKIGGKEEKHGTEGWGAGGRGGAGDEPGRTAEDAPAEKVPLWKGDRDEGVPGREEEIPL